MIARKGPAPAFQLSSRVNAPRSWWLGLSRDAHQQTAAQEQARMASNPHKGFGAGRIVGSGRAITGAR